MADRTFRPARSLGKYAGASICAILLASCASTGGGGKANVAGGDDYKDAIGAFSTRKVRRAGATTWASSAPASGTLNPVGALR